MAAPIIWEGKRKDNAIKIILERIANEESLRTILNKDRDKNILPSRALFHNWLINDTELIDQYARAAELRADNIFDEILEIADDGSNDFMEKQGKDGEVFEVFNAEHVQRSRLRIDARKWMLGKMNPKKYGDRVGIDHTSTDGSMSPKAPVSLDDWYNPKRGE